MLNGARAKPRCRKASTSACRGVDCLRSLRVLRKPRSRGSRTIVCVLHTLDAVTNSDFFHVGLSYQGPLSHSIIQAAPNGGSYLYITLCAVSIAVGALTYSLGSTLAVLGEFKADRFEKRNILYTVDVTERRFFDDPHVLAAVEFAADAHKEQRRKTGEPYVSHCIETALIVEHNLPQHVANDYERYRTSIIVALLHDVIDDTQVEASAIEAAFGPTVAKMVSQVSKLSQMNQLLRRGKRKGWARYSEEHFKQLRKIIMDMVVEEPLIILIKLADRLHNMRTVYVLKPEKQAAVAGETVDVWCTMAECLGWDALKSELEDLCLAVMEPQKYCKLRCEMDASWNLQTLKVLEEEALGVSYKADTLDPEDQDVLPNGGPAKATIGSTCSDDGWTMSSGDEDPADLASGSSPYVAEVQLLLEISSTIPSSAELSVGSDGEEGAESSGSYSQAFQNAMQKLLRINQSHNQASPGPQSETTPPQAPKPAPSPRPPSSVAPSNLIPLMPWPQGAQSSTSSTRGKPYERNFTPANSATAVQPIIPGLALRTLQGAEPLASLAAQLAPGGASKVKAPPLINNNTQGSDSSKLTPTSTLTVQQQRLKTIFSTVAPFDSNNFRSTSAMASSTRKGLATLEQCASQLYYELQSRSSGVDIMIQGRLKSLYSVTKKMERKKCSMSQVYDCRALRVVVDDESKHRHNNSVEACYKLVAVVHSIWRPIRGEFDDYIANPKPSGYQALHTAVRGPGGITMEIQIKTSSMHELAEYGAAAHWVYKEYPQGVLPVVGQSRSPPASKSSSKSSQQQSSPPKLQPSSKEVLKSTEQQEQMVIASAAVTSAISSDAQRHGEQQQEQEQGLAQRCKEQQQQQGKEQQQEQERGLAQQRKEQQQQGKEQQQDKEQHLTVEQTGEQRSVALASSKPTTSMPETTSTLFGAASSQPLAASTHASSAVMSEPCAMSRAVSHQISTPTSSPAPPLASSPTPSPPSPRTSSPSSSPASVSPAKGLASSSLSPSYSSKAAVAVVDPPPTSVPSLPSAGDEPPRRLPKIRGVKGYVGQPLLRVEKYRLRYGVVLSRDADGEHLLVAIKSGSTFNGYPTRVPDYTFYLSLMHYIKFKGWGLAPGRGDFTMRLEEYELAKDGRYYRRDYMGYLLRFDTITLLEGYEDVAEASQIAYRWPCGDAEGYGEEELPPSPLPASSTLSASRADSSDAVADKLRESAQGGDLAIASTAPTAPSAGAGADASARGLVVTEGNIDSAELDKSEVLTEEREEGEEASIEASLSSQQREMGPEDVLAMKENQERFRKQMQDAYARTQQLRSMIEWGRSAMTKDLPEESLLSEEVGVIVWPGASIEYLPRGTTVGQIVRTRGLVDMAPHEIEDASEQYWRSSDMLVNVNNRLVPESTVLNDGDLVILAREKMEI